MKLEVKNISKSYRKKTVLREVNQSFTYGVYGVLGPNGAGKTTLLNIIATVLSADGGEILYDGKDVYGIIGEYRSKIGYLPQKIGFYSHFTGYEMMKYMNYLKGGRDKDTEQVDEILKKMNLYGVKDSRIGTYSGGMKQRLGIAQALLGNPELLLLDEPTVGLDVEERAQFKKIIRGLHEDTAVLLSTHIVSDIEETADRVLIMSEGEILENNGMDYYKDYMEKNGISGLEEYYLKRTGRELHDSGN